MSKTRSAFATIVTFVTLVLFDWLVLLCYVAVEIVLKCKGFVTDVPDKRFLLLRLFSFFSIDRNILDGTK